MALVGFKKKSFSLLLRGSRDGFSAAAFHRLCDGKPNTLTIVKNTNNCIFGGFTSIPWSSSLGCTSDTRAFLFTLTNPSNNPFKLRITDPDTAVFHNSTTGPIFGDCSDLNIHALSHTRRDNYVNLKSYEFPNGKSGDEGGKFIVGGTDNQFQTVEIEVFQVL
jgi:hypothetical protein